MPFCGHKAVLYTLRHGGKLYMELFWDWIRALALDIWGTLKLIRPVDVFDIFFVSLLFYSVYKFIKTRRAGKLALGVAVFIVLLMITRAFDMQTAQFLLTNVFQIGLITVIVVFQPELRSALEMLGGESIKGVKALGESKSVENIRYVIDEVSTAVFNMSEEKTGALVVMERTTLLGDQIITGTVINADVQAELIKNIFFNKAPLHDGAMIIRDGRIHAAGCLLPLTQRTDLIKSLGMRHRAAIGLSENSDAVVIVVSEETGNVSLVRDGEITSNYTCEKLKSELLSLFDADEENSKYAVIKRVKRTKKASKND